MPSVYVKTLGCKVNTFDSHVLENQFRAEGYDLVASAAAADVTVVNTCSVTSNADREARYLARRYRRESPETVLVFTGCYAQTDSAALVAMDEVDLVVPNAAKEQLLGIVQAAVADGSGRGRTGSSKMPPGSAVVAANKQGHFKTAAVLFDEASSEQTRAFVKIQDGCNGFCTYCLIPYARGASRSVAPAAALAEIARLVTAGTREIVLTGIHIGDYGQDLAEYQGHPHPIVALVEQILAIPGLTRLRISSLEPGELSPALAELLGSFPDKVCAHLHLPLQSGSDRILKLMRRSYDRAGYTAAVARFRAHFPAACIGADVIPGFPGETPADFADTVALIQTLDLAYLHVFPYSSRPNTAALRLPGHVSPDVVKERAGRLRELSSALSKKYAQQFIGSILPVLWEKDQDAQGRRLGRTMNYLHVVASASAPPAPGSTSLVQIKGLVDQDRLLGRVLAV